MTTRRHIADPFCLALACISMAAGCSIKSLPTGPGPDSAISGGDVSDGNGDAAAGLDVQPDVHQTDLSVLAPDVAPTADLPVDSRAGSDTGTGGVGGMDALSATEGGGGTDAPLGRGGAGNSDSPVAAGGVGGSTGGSAGLGSTSTTVTGGAAGTTSVGGMNSTGGFPATGGFVNQGGASGGGTPNTGGTSPAPSGGAATGGTSSTGGAGTGGTNMNPYVVGACKTDDARGVAIAGSFAYVADGSSGLRIVDISNPIAPSIVGTAHTTDASGVAVSGTFAYVADSTSGLKIIDVTSPTGPTVIGSYAFAGFGAGVDSLDTIIVAGGKAYGTGWALDLSVFDVSTPTSPQLLGTGAVSGAGLAFDGTYVYVIGFDGFAIVNASNASSPITVGSLRLASVPGESAGIALHGGRAYIAPGYSGLGIVNTSNVYSPQLVGQWSNIEPYALALDNHRLTLIGSSTTRVFDCWIVDISQPDSPQTVGHTSEIPGAAQNGIATQGDYAYVAAGSTGLVVLHLPIVN